MDSIEKKDTLLTIMLVQHLPNQTFTPMPIVQQTISSCVPQADQANKSLNYSTDFY